MHALDRISGNAGAMKETDMQVPRRFLILSCLAMLVASTNARGAQVPSATSADQEALAALVQELDAAYDAQDAVRFSAVFADDANFQFPVEGLALRGRDEVRRHFAKQFAALPPLRHVTTTGDLDLLGPGILAVDLQVDILAIDPKTGVAQTLFHYGGLGLGIRTDAGWRIRLVRLYPVAKPSAATMRSAE
jgi:uncharacterized protein (TIGR02246 family)